MSNNPSKLKYYELRKDFTLKNLVMKMNPLGLDMSTNQFVYCFLPDIAVPKPSSDRKKRAKTISVQDPVLIPGEKETYFAILNARADIDDAAYGDKYVTLQLLNAIINDQDIIYSNRGDYRIGCRKQMINKISYYVSQSDENNIKNILANPPIQVFPSTQAYCRQDFVDAIRCLYESATYGGYVYGIFLLIMNTIFYNDMSTLFPLFRKEKIDEVIRTSGGPQVYLPDYHCMLDDKMYFGRYYVYLFKDHFLNLYQNGLLSIETQEGKTSVILELEESNNEKGGDMIHKYVGDACVSENDQSVYSMMFDEANHNAIGIMCFRYSAVRSGYGMRYRFGMYYRSGLLLTTDSNQVPECRKIILTERKMNDHELCYVKGMLKTSGSQITLSESQIDDFLEKHKNAKLYPWLKEFEDKILPFIKANYGQTPLFSFDEKAVLSYPNATLTREDRLRIMLALKACCANADEKYSRIHCDDEGVSDILC